VSDDAQARLEALEREHRELVLSTVGLDPGSEHAQALEALHEGDWKPEAVRETAEAYGLTLEAHRGDGLSDDNRQAIASFDRGMQAMAMHTPTDTLPTLDDRIREAEAEAMRTNEWEEFNRLQTIAVHRMGR
jgi:hypothetical protein